MPHMAIGCCGKMQGNLLDKLQDKLLFSDCNRLERKPGDNLNCFEKNCLEHNCLKDNSLQDNKPVADNKPVVNNKPAVDNISAWSMTGNCNMRFGNLHWNNILKRLEWNNIL